MKVVTSYELKVGRPAPRLACAWSQGETPALSLPGVKAWARDSSLGLSFLICDMQIAEPALTQIKVTMTLGEPT